MLTLTKNKFFNYYLPLFLTAVVLATTAGIYFAVKNQPLVAEASWYNNSWLYRKPITLDHTKVSTASSTTLSNFPVLISVTDPDLKNYASSTGADILFTAADGVTKLNHEIESYTSASGTLLAWVQVPTLSPTVNTLIYIYFGNLAASSQQSVSATWNDGGSNYYQAVWHFPTSLGLGDSSGNGYSGINSGVTAATGQIDGGASLSGSNQYITAAAPISLGTLHTTSAWIKPNGQNGSFNFGPITGNHTSDNVDSLYIGGSTDNSIGYTQGTGGFGATVSSMTGAWHYVVVVRNGITGQVYLDGQAVATTGSLQSNEAASIIYIGSRNGPSSLDYTGGLDELRLATVVRSPDWIVTEYNNQSSPATFYSYGSLDTQGSVHININNRSWYNPAWQFRMPLTINHAQVASSSSTSLTNFPILVSLTSTNLKYTGSGGGVASSTGGDLLFTDGNGTTKLPFEIESYASSTGAIIAWVEVPNVSALTDHTIYVYYGNANSTNQQNASGVWDSNYKGVWHLPNGTSLTAGDSSSNGNNGSITGATATTGKIDGGGNFGGSSDYITLGKNNLPSAASATMIEGWFNAAVATGGYRAGASIGDVSTASTGYFILNHNGDLIGGLQSHFITDAGVFSSPGWHHVAVAYDGTTQYLYVDGSLYSSNAQSYNIQLSNTHSQVGIGIDADVGSSDPYWQGSIDEVRFSNIARSGDWVKTEYNNQSSPSTFITAGSQQASLVNVSNWYNASWAYRKPIIIDHTKVSTASGTTLSNFPMLFSTTDNDLRYTGSGGKVASSTGGDFLFTDSDGLTKLPFELESYSSTTGTTIAWVQIPTLSPTTDYTIYIYFGNANATNQQNVNGVWSNNYLGVYHLPNGSTLNVNDSTSNGKTLTNVGGATAVTGKIDGGVGLNGSSQKLNNTSWLSQPGAITLSVWVYNTAFSHSYNTVIGTHNASSLTTYADIHIKSNGMLAMYAAPVASYTYYDGTGINTLATNTWYYLTLTYDSTNGLRGYVNGSLDGSGAANGALNSNNSVELEVGDDSPNDPRYITGTIDEPRISSVARSVDWIKTEYNNQNSPSTFYIYGAVGVNGRQNAAGASVPAMSVHGNVKFH